MGSGVSIYKLYQTTFSRSRPSHDDLYKALVGIAIYGDRRHEMTGVRPPMDNHKLITYYQNDIGAEALAKNEQIKSHIEENVLDTWDHFYEFLNRHCDRMEKK